MNTTRKWIALLAMMLLALSLTVTNASADTTAVVNAREGVVRVLYAYTYNGDEYVSIGSGFCIGESGKPVEFILTNAHVVTATDQNGAVLGYADEVRIVFDDVDSDSTVSAKVLKVFTNGVDLAVLRLEAPTSLRKPLSLASANSVSIMDRVYALGFPAIADDSSGIIKSTVEDVTITEGSVTKEQYLDGDTKYLQIDNVISSGNSGGPLVNEDGSVVGINTQVADPYAGSSLGYALYIDYAIEYLDTMGYPYSAGTVAAFEESPEVEVTAGVEVPQPAPATLPWYIITAIAVSAAAVITLAILLAVKSKKKAPASDSSGGATSPVYTPPKEVPYKGRQIVNIGQASTLNGKAYPVRGKIVVGRDSKKCGVVFPAKTPGISSVHCAVQEIAEGVVVTDLGSTYGTFLENGTKLEPNKPYTIPSGEAFYLASKDNGFRVK